MADLPTQGYSYIDPVTGQPAQGLTPPPGVIFRDSALLQSDPNGNLTHTAQGDPFNSFRGYVNEQGGTFGGANADKGPDAQTWTGIANKDKASILKGLQSSDPALKQAAQSYALGLGSKGYTGNNFAGDMTSAIAQAKNLKGTNAQGSPFGNATPEELKAFGVDPNTDWQNAAFNASLGKDANYNVWNDPTSFAAKAVAAQALADKNAPPPPAPPEADPFGRFDAPTAANRVIKPGDEARMAAQAMQIQQPPVDGGLPTQRTPMQAPSDATPDPFAAFTGTPVPPQPTPTVPGATIGGGLPAGTEMLPPPVPEGPGFLGGANPEPPLSPSMGAPNDFGGTAAVNVTDGPGIAMPRPGIRPIRPINGAGAPPLRPASGMFPGLKPPQMRPIAPRPASGAAPAPVPSY